MRRYFLIGSLLLSACSASVEDLVSPQTSDGDESGVFFGARTSDAITVLQVPPSSERALPFGPPLPVVRPESYQFRSIITNPSGTRALVVLESTHDGTPAAIFAGDGRSWWLIREQNTVAVGRIVTSRELDLIWTDGPSSGSMPLEWHPMVHTFDGAIVFDGGSHPSEVSEKFAGFAPDGTYVVFARAGALVLRTTRGEESIITSDTKVLQSYNFGLFATFPTSIVLAGPYPELRWVDLSGDEVLVPGFVGSQESTGNGYQIVLDQVSRLEDRKLTLLQTVASARGDPDNILALVPDAFALIKREEALILSDANENELARYQPPTSGLVVQSHERLTVSIIGPHDIQFSQGRAVFLTGAHNMAFSGDSARNLGDAIDVFSFVDGEARSTRIRDVSASPYPRYQLSKGGRFVLWSESGSILRMDLVSEEQSIVLRDDFEVVFPL